VLKIVLIVLIAEIFTAAGHILFKKTTNELGTHKLGNIEGHGRFIADVIKRPAIWVGFVLMGLGLVAWIIALSQGDLSLVFPLGSIQYLIILFSAKIFLGEEIDRMKLIGTLLVVAGIVLITIS